MQAYGKPAEERGFKRDVAVLIFMNMDGSVTRVDTVALCGRLDCATGTHHRQICNQSFAHDKRSDLIAILMAVIVENMRSHTYPYVFLETEEGPSSLPNVYSSGVYAPSIQAMTCIVPVKLPEAPSPRPAPRQDDEGKVVESIEDDVSTSADIRGFNETAYKCIGIWVRIDQIQHVQHPLRDVDAVHASELERSSRRYGAIYSSGLISVSTV